MERHPLKPVRAFLPVAILVFVVSCTDNPFVEEEEVSPMSIRGRVLLEDGSSPDSIFVWLEGVRVSTWTDDGGRFLLSLPAPSGGSGVTGHDGTFLLYFYVANYRIATAEVVLVRGDVVRSRGDVDEKGALKQTIHLKRILEVHTQVFPESFVRQFRGQVTVLVTLRAVSDDVTVESLMKVEGQVLRRSGLLIVDQGGKFVNAIGLEADWRLSGESIGRQSNRWRISLRWPPCDLLDGQYTMIPYLLVRQENLRPELLEDMGEGVGELGPNYLTLPFRRGGGEFLISQ